MIIEFKWERLPDDNEYTERAMVFGGWLVRVRSNMNEPGYALMFVSDPQHDWEIS